MNREITKFNEFRKDEDGVYYYYDTKETEDMWSYDLDALAKYITYLQQECKSNGEIINALQQELKETNESITWWQNRWTAQVNLRKKYFEENEHLETQLNTLKSKINKAIEYIKNNSLYYEDYDYDLYEELYLADIVDSEAKQDLLNILQNGSEKND